MSTRVWQPMVFIVLSYGLAFLPVQAQTMGPLANTTVGNARLIVPDGSSVRQSIGAGETRWFVFGAEPGKTYVVEAVDPDSDLVSNTIGSLHVYAANGSTTPPPETNVDCTASTQAPALEVPVAVDGMRCVVRAFPPTPGNTQNKRGLYVAVGSVSGPSFDLRVRESTIYGRWTTNGYDFHVELENTTTDSMCAEVMLLPNSGNSYAGTWSGAVTTQTLTIPPFGANKMVFPNGTLVGSDLRGPLRIGACSNPVNLMPSGLHVSTYAFSPGIKQYLYFFTTAANNGAASNSWSAASSAGTVTSVGTGPGLSGGPITTAGTINLAATNLLPTVACATNQVPKWNGSAWTCAADTNSGGTVTSVATGSGLTGGPITGSGTINLAATNLLPLVACAANQIPKWNGNAWSCAADSTGPANAFVQGGNAFGATALLGTNDNQPLDLRVNGSRVMHYEPNATSRNIIGGNYNSWNPTHAGQTIGGGGQAGSNCIESNQTSTRACWNATDADFATVGGGYANQANGFKSFVGGGVSNTASGQSSVVGGGSENTASGQGSTVSGGEVNRASDLDSTVGGGTRNTASGVVSTVSGGAFNKASGLSSAVPGGEGNIASGNYSFAAGVNAIASHHRSFVWGGDPNSYTSSQADGDFVVYAPGAVRLFAGPPLSGGCTLTGGSGWACASDRALKSDVVAVDGREVLDQVVALPVARWTFASVPGIEHMGPMAQDFHAAFGLGDDATRLAPMDVQGVALAAIQGLNAKLEERVADQQREIAELRERVNAAESLRGELAALRAELANLRETRTQITARAPAAADSFRADVAR